MNINVKQLVVQTIFAFVLFLMPTIALEPQDNSIYTVSDFFAYYTQATMLVRNPGCDIYSEQPMMAVAAQLFPELRTHGWYLVGEPPVSLTFLIPVFLLPAAYSLLMYKIFLVLCISLSVALLVQIFELNERQFQASSIAIALSGPLWEATRVTKPGIIVLLAFTLCLLALKSKKPIAAAVCFLPWTFKPQLMVLFIGEMLAARNWKFIISLIAATAALLLVTFPLFGVVNYKEWLEVIRYGTAHPEMNTPFLHPTIRGQMMRFTSTPESIIKVLATLAFVAAQLAGLFLGFRARNKPNQLLICVLAMPLSVVCSPYCHNYDLVILIPSIIAFFTLPGLKTLPQATRVCIYVVVSLCLLVFEMPIYNRIFYDFIQHPILTVSPLFCALMILSLIFMTMAYRETAT